MVVAVVVVGGFLFGPVNNPCPQGQCSGQNPGIYFTITFTGYVVNPTWNVMYATIEANGPNNQPCQNPCGLGTGISMQASGAPGLFGNPPTGDFWTNNYKLTGSYTITFPSGASYTYSIKEIDGTVPGSSQVAWSQVVYGQGPHGSYGISLTLNYAQTGGSVAGQVIARATQTI